MRFRTVYRNYIIRNMTKKYAADAASWKYEPPLDVYNSDGTQEAARDFTGGLHFSFCDKDTENMLGFICLGPKAQLPLPDLEEIYSDESFTDIAIGLRPELVGKHIGSDLLDAAIYVAETIFPGDGIRLTAATDNCPAMTLYKRKGFEEICSFEAEIIYIDKNGEEKKARKDMIIMCLAQNASECP